MSKHAIAKIMMLLMALLLSACVPIQVPVTTEGETAPNPRVAEARRGAGPVISAEATIMEWPAEPGGEWTVLREGSNEWTCLPGPPYYPEGIGRPMCIDEVWLAFMKARMAGEEFAPFTTPGIGYMLDGGGGPSISDPYVTEPGPGEKWIKDAPPHLMLLIPGDLASYPLTPGPEPWTMFSDTSFAHLMVALPMPE